SNGKRDNRCWKAGVSMMEVLMVMTYFQISLPTHNWDSAFFLAFNTIWPIFSRIVVRDLPFMSLARA
ncbi:hypothetical protein, partial [Aeromonas dhakensis]